MFDLCMFDGTKQRKKKEKKKQKKQQTKKCEKKREICTRTRPGRIFTYLYFSHARIRAACICLINIFPGGLSRGYSNFSRGAEISALLEYRKIAFPPLRAFFSRLHSTRNPVTTAWVTTETKRTTLTKPISICQPRRGFNSLCQFIDVESARQLDTMLHRGPAHTYARPVFSFVFTKVNMKANFAKFWYNLFSSILSIFC